MAKKIVCPNCGFSQKQYTTNIENQVITCLKCNYRWVNIKDSSIKESSIKVVMDSANHYKHAVNNLDNKKDSFPFYTLNNSYIDKVVPKQNINLKEAISKNNNTIFSDYNARGIINTNYAKVQGAVAGNPNYAKENREVSGNNNYARVERNVEGNKDYAKVQGAVAGNPNYTKENREVSGNNNYARVERNVEGNKDYAKVQGAVAGNPNYAKENREVSGNNNYARVERNVEGNKDYAKVQREVAGNPNYAKENREVSGNNNYARVERNVEGNKDYAKVQGAVAGNPNYAKENREVSGNNNYARVERNVEGNKDYAKVQGTVAGNPNYAKENREVSGNNNYARVERNVEGNKDYAKVQREVAGNPNYAKENREVSGNNNYARVDRNRDEKSSLVAEKESIKANISKENIDNTLLNKDRNINRDNSNIVSNNDEDALKKTSNPFAEKYKKIKEQVNNQRSNLASLNSDEEEDIINFDKKNVIGKDKVNSISKNFDDSTIKAKDKSSADNESKPFSHNSFKIDKFKAMVKKELEEFEQSSEEIDDEYLDKFNFSKAYKKLSSKVQADNQNETLKEVNNLRSVLEDNPKQNNNLAKKFNVQNNVLFNDIKSKTLKADNKIQNMLSSFDKQGLITEPYIDHKEQVRQEIDSHVEDFDYNKNSNNNEPSVEKTENTKEKLNYSYSEGLQEVQQKIINFYKNQGKLKFIAYIVVIAIVIYLINSPLFLSKQSAEEIFVNSSAIKSIPAIDDPQVNAIVPSKDSDFQGLILGNNDSNNTAPKSQNVVTVKEDGSKQIVQVDMDNLLKEPKVEGKNKEGISNIEEKEVNNESYFFSIKGYFNDFFLETKNKAYNIFNDLKIINVQSQWARSTIDRTFEIFITVQNTNKKMLYVLNNLEVILVDEKGIILEKRIITPNQIMDSMENVVLKIKIGDVPLKTKKAYAFVKEITPVQR